MFKVRALDSLKFKLALLNNFNKIISNNLGKIFNKIYLLNSSNNINKIFKSKIIFKKMICNKKNNNKIMTMILAVKEQDVLEDTIEKIDKKFNKNNRNKNRNKNKNKKLKINNMKLNKNNLNKNILMIDLYQLNKIIIIKINPKNFLQKKKTMNNKMKMIFN